MRVAFSLSFFVLFAVNSLLAMEKPQLFKTEKEIDNHLQKLDVDRELKKLDVDSQLKILDKLSQDEHLERFHNQLLLLNNSIDLLNNDKKKVCKSSPEFRRQTAELALVHLVLAATNKSWQAMHYMAGNPKTNLIKNLIININAQHSFEIDVTRAPLFSALLQTENIFAIRMAFLYGNKNIESDQDKKIWTKLASEDPITIFSKASAYSYDLDKLNKFKEAAKHGYIPSLWYLAAELPIFVEKKIINKDEALTMWRSITKDYRENYLKQYPSMMGILAEKLKTNPQLFEDSSEYIKWFQDGAQENDFVCMINYATILTKRNLIEAKIWARRAEGVLEKINKNPRYIRADLAQVKILDNLGDYEKAIKKLFSQIKEQSNIYESRCARKINKFKKFKNLLQEFADNFYDEHDFDANNFSQASSEQTVMAIDSLFRSTSNDDVRKIASPSQKQNALSRSSPAIKIGNYPPKKETDKKVRFQQDEEFLKEVRSLLLPVKDIVEKLLLHKGLSCDEINKLLVEAKIKRSKYIRTRNIKTNAIIEEEDIGGIDGVGNKKNTVAHENAELRNIFSQFDITNNNDLWPND